MKLAIRTKKTAAGTYAWTITFNGKATGWNQTQATTAIGARVQAGPWLREQQEAAAWVDAGNGPKGPGHCDFAPKA